MSCRQSVWPMPTMQRQPIVPLDLALHKQRHASPYSIAREQQTPYYDEAMLNFSCPNSHQENIPLKH